MDIKGSGNFLIDGLSEREWYKQHRFDDELGYDSEDDDLDQEKIDKRGGVKDD